MLDEHHIKQSQDTETISRLVEDNRNLSTENARLHMWGKALDNAHKVDRGVIKNLNTAKSNVEIELARCQARVGCLQDALNAARYHNNHLMEERQKLWEEAKAGSRANREALRGAMNLNANKLAERPIKTENVKNE